MSTSGEMRSTIPATMQDLNSLEERLSKNLNDTEGRLKQRQTDYEVKCEEDRKSLRGEIESVKTIATRLEEKTDEGNRMLEPITKAFKGILAQPKVQAGMLAVVMAMIGVILALAGYATSRLKEMTPTAPPITPQPIIVIPQSSLDGGVPSVTVHTQ